jgi:hypothetical protein
MAQRVANGVEIWAHGEYSEAAVLLERIELALFPSTQQNQLPIIANPTNLEAKHPPLFHMSFLTPFWSRPHIIFHFRSWDLPSRPSNVSLLKPGNISPRTNYV